MTGDPDVRRILLGEEGKEGSLEKAVGEVKVSLKGSSVATSSQKTRIHNLHRSRKIAEIPGNFYVILYIYHLTIYRYIP